MILPTFGVQVVPLTATTVMVMVMVMVIRNINSKTKSKSKCKGQRLWRFLAFCLRAEGVTT